MMLNRIIRNKAAIRIILRLLIIYSCFYVLNYVLTGYIQLGGYYSSWLAKHFDYVTAFRTFLLSITMYVVEQLGHDAYIMDNILYVKNGNNIRMVYSCMGLNLLFVWWSFVIALPMQLVRKFLHFTLGTICLIVLNITRLSMLTMSPDHYSLGELIIDHHTIYNCVVYGLIFFVVKKVTDIQLSK